MIGNPVTRRMCVQLGMLRIAIDHSDDELSQRFVRELGRHLVSPLKAERVAATLSLIPTSQLPALPSKAEFVRKEADAEIFQKGPVRCVLGAGYCVIHNTEASEVQLFYHEGTAVYVRARSSLKWLLITTAERMGYFYLHASVCTWKGRTFVFCGDSGAGKTSSLIRSARLGAHLVADDLLLSNSHGIHPIYLGMRIKGDAPDRFAVSDGELMMENVGTLVNSPQPGPHTLVLIKAWRTSSSLLRPIRPGRGALQLWKMYEKECAYNAVSQSREKWLLRAKGFFHDARFFEFFMGDEEEKLVFELRQLFEG